MISNIKFCLKHRGMVSRFNNISFNRAMNVIVGPNGSGKSSVLRSIYECPDCKKEEDGKTFYYYFDSETMNPHRSQDVFGGMTGSLIRVRAMFSSHGETMRDVLGFANFKKGDTLLLDEPEAGHDFQWVTKIQKGLKKIVRGGCQVIMASHHPVFWDAGNIIELRKGYKNKTLNFFMNISNHV
ncbi:MAG: AAA family ATPase [Candidatus Omnitrophica bacterium]|nr:AAA family ATPase [Candidatus Omnitrophota bacterium]